MIRVSLPPFMIKAVAVVALLFLYLPLEHEGDEVALRVEMNQSPVFLRHLHFHCVDELSLTRQPLNAQRLKGGHPLALAPVLHFMD